MKWTTREQLLNQTSLSPLLLRQDRLSQLQRGLQSQIIMTLWLRSRARTRKKETTWTVYLSKTWSHQRIERQLIKTKLKGLRKDSCLRMLMMKICQISEDKNRSNRFHQDCPSRTKMITWMDFLAYQENHKSKLRIKLSHSKLEINWSQTIKD